jgi:outer membrane biosynthesis protein TonB
MTMAMRAVVTGPREPKALHLGVVEGGAITLEKLFRDRRVITIGRDEKCDLVVSADKATLFSPAPDGRLWLHLHPGMTGRVSTGDGTRDVAAVVASGVTKISLDDRARGRVALGGIVVLLQMVHPPPVTPRPQLPAAVQGGFWRSIDWRFTGFVTATFLGFMSFMLYLEGADFPVAESVAMIPADYAMLVMEEPEPPPEPDVPEVVDGESVDVPSDALADARDVRRDTAPDRPDRPRPTDEPPSLVDRETIRTAALLEIGSLLRTGEGPTALDDLMMGADTSDAASVLAMVDATTSSAYVDPSALHERGGASGRPTSTDLGHLSIAGHDAANTMAGEGPPEERVITGWVTPESPTDEGGRGVFEAALVTARVRSLMSGIRRCYEAELLRDPTLSGKVTTKFTILESGTVTGVRAIENTTGNGQLAACVGGIIGRMRFRSGPEGGSVDFSYPFVFAPQQ